MINQKYLTQLASTCLKLTIETNDWRCCYVFIVNFEHSVSIANFKQVNAEWELDTKIYF